MSAPDRSPLGPAVFSTGLLDQLKERQQSRKPHKRVFSQPRVSLVYSLLDDTVPNQTRHLYKYSTTFTNPFQALRSIESTLFKHCLESIGPDTVPWRPHEPTNRSRYTVATRTGSDQDLRCARDMSKRQDFTRERPAEHGDRMRIGDYTLGATLGEGEFGKVKIGWKKDSGNQVAVKIIRKEKLDSPGRLTKVHREIAILKQLDHPNIVHLYEMVETDHTIGIILEYASGGELFDYILKKRHLDDNQARRLFAQLVSGVGYLHRNGIIHRDLKLENLLLDSKHNIIITDFGFANTFDPLGRSNLEKDHEKNFDYSELKNGKIVDRDGHALPTEEGYKHDDLMSTSCGSPCYAAPELVVSDGLYSGKKVDVWSCGVILYAMLAGYLPFDDDPDNPEGDNINLLYKYICSTPLIFPNWVSAYARDILKQILVPDPNNRADLFTVARHSWLMDYAHVVEAITSNVKLSPEEYERVKALQIPVYEFSSPKGTVQGTLDKQKGPKTYTYSGSKPSQRQASENLASAGPAENARTSQQKQAEMEARQKRSPREQKRRTVQVEYVPPRSSHNRELSEPKVPEDSPLVLHESSADTASHREVVASSATKGDGSAQARPSHDTGRRQQRAQVTRSTSDNRVIPPTNLAFDHYRTSYSRPQSQRIIPPSRGSYGQPSSAEVQHQYAQGQISAPTSKPLPASPTQRDSEGRLRMPPAVEGPNQAQKISRTHKRSSTLTSISDKLLNRASSMSRRGGRPSASKPDRSYPPTTMTYQDLDGLNQKQVQEQQVPTQSPTAQLAPPRKSGEGSKRRSFGFYRKNSDVVSSPQEKLASNRFAKPSQMKEHKNFRESTEPKSGSSKASQRVMNLFRFRR
ncbi:MAG: hypothetical protein Q9159_005965 [Coniocarpon cinnabarinum]